ncbi:YybH family protein [Nonomuraea jiangxiensis]|uniref:Ketosteroid isomerase homolog n=1 Tax=Nonomuraea jiangxiensis TaxID=633440 RepID=A0A1G9U803_9ACTN|nr:nuclear transport factor 2 family protein [Nonomuraea jiangxiensis]SDM55942.1 Ketosteroid isomerase homolog [Nonomuraea jiangxiensis]
MSKIFQRKALLLAAIVPALLVAGCSAGSQQAMKGAASPPTGESTVEPGEVSPGMTETGTASPTVTGVEGARTAVEDYFNALKAGDVDKVVDSFSDNAVVELNGQATAKGPEAIRTLYQKQLQGNEMKQATHTIEDTRAAGAEDAIVRATSKQGQQSYRELFVLMQDGGQWKISELMNNRAS